MTLHPRVYLQPAHFSAMVLPFWLFMTRNLYVDTGDVSCSSLLVVQEQEACLKTAMPLHTVPQKEHNPGTLMSGRFQADLL